MSIKEPDWSSLVDRPTNHTFSIHKTQIETLLKKTTLGLFGLMIYWLKVT